MAQHYNLQDYQENNTDIARYGEEPKRPKPESLEQDFRFQPQERKDLHSGVEAQNISTQNKNLLKIAKAISERPTIVTDFIHSLPSDAYELVKPVQIILKIYDDEIIAIIPELELFSEGASEIEAINTIKLEVIDLLEDLEEIPDQELGRGPKTWKKALSLMVRKCQ